nr:pyridoxamine 5'-phosphate oxidase family protein [Tissierella sp.]
MRRRDREMDKEFGFKIIDCSRYGVLSMIDKENLPYGLPLSMVRDGNAIYFHSANEGKKVEVLKTNSKVAITFVGEVRVPENYSYDELEAMKDDPSKAVKFISSVFTTEFESALVKGEAEIIEDEEEKIYAMKLICEKYTPSKMEYFSAAIGAGISRTRVYKIEIQDISAKRKKYDEKGVEMKWGRID